MLGLPAKGWSAHCFFGSLVPEYHLLLVKTINLMSRLEMDLYFPLILLEQKIVSLTLE